VALGVEEDRCTDAGREQEGDQELGWRHVGHEPKVAASTNTFAAQLVLPAFAPCERRVDELL
jgi:hypothetical protein